MTEVDIKDLTALKTGMAEGPGVSDDTESEEAGPLSKC